MIVSVVVPCRNEIRHLDAFLKSLAAQELSPGCEVECLIADGMSDDGTREVLEQWRRTLKDLVVIDNPRRTVPCAMNLGIGHARGEIIIRMDVHAEYAPDYIRQCVATLLETKADNVGGPAATKADEYMERAICLGYHSRFSNGGARFHDPVYEGYVDTVPFGCWHRSTLEELGGFDEAFTRNQDDELNLRLIRSGRKIWQTPLIRLWYRPRSSVSALARQYFQYGYWKVYVLQKHKIPASWRHLVPGAFVGSLVVLALAAPFSSLSAVTLLALSSVYGLASGIASIAACRQPKDFSLLPVMPVVFAAYQFSYGLGFLRGLWDVAVNRAPAASASSLVR